jgi:hypothetical protein
LNATEAADKAEADELRAELERERARVDAANLRAEASASAAAGKEAVMGEHDAAGCNSARMYARAWTRVHATFALLSTIHASTQAHMA